MTAAFDKRQDQIERNIGIHDKVAARYDARHGEIFNEVEQSRLADALGRAMHKIRTGSDPIAVLDYGCGSGNLTRHLLSFGAEVVAADVSPRFLELVKHRYNGAPLTTLLMNGRDLSGVPDDSFDLVATYSVLHHIPDYLGAIREMARVCKPGGLVYLDHEPTKNYWENRPVYDEYRASVERRDWRKYLVPGNYLHKIIRVFNPRHSNEGDIHVWDDDHIDWELISELLIKAGFEIAMDEDYLLYRSLYRPEIYQRYNGTLADTKLMAFRKIAR